ncbi:MAG: Flp pilus assembly complex ATPase component [Calditrichaeota bacterium]|nr:Flp pilus assembly complex ATPase component [Calditrichota bacterium]
MEYTQNNNYRNKRLGEILVEKGLISPEDLEKAFRMQKKTGERLGKILVDQGFLSEEDLLKALSLKLNIPTAKIDSYAIDPSVVEIITRDIAEKHKIIPLFKVNDTLTVAMADPLDVYVVDYLRHKTGLNIQTVLASESDIQKAIEKYYRVQNSLDKVIHDIQMDDTLLEEPAAEMFEDSSEEGSSIVKVVNLILTQAIRDRASDIHIEPDEKIMRIRNRIDGILHQAFTLPFKFHAMVVSRIKIMSNLDVSERRLPQDGRFQYKAGEKIVDLRVSVLPTVRGEKVVMRILDKSGFILDLSRMGFSPEVSKKWDYLIHRPQGLILITGPTGSGKTSTLYASLNEINTPDKNIITVENPVEYNFPLINQVQVNPKAGLTFAAGLRSILRQDPDVIMVGEIRDPESAEIALRAALTGHLVLSTLHTNDAPSAVTRLVDMGLEPFLVASSLLGVLAQRLARRLCDVCKTEVILSPEKIRSLGLGEDYLTKTFYKAEGCRECHRSGYKGRVGIHELLLVDDELQRLILKNATDHQIREVAIKRGMRPLRLDGLRKAAEGLTSVEEILRVT